MNYAGKVREIFSSQALRAIYRWSKPVRSDVLLIALLGVSGSLISLAVAMITKHLIDGATGGRAEALWKYGTALVLLIVIQRLFSVLMSRLRLKASVRFQRHMQQTVIGEIMGKEYAALKPYHSGQLVNRVFSDVSVVKNGILNFIPSLLSILASFIGAAVILIRMDWRFIPVLIIAGAAGATLSVLFREPMKRRHKRMQEAEDNLHASAQETLENVRLIKASVSEKYALENMDEQGEKLKEEQIRNGKLSILMNQGMGGMFDVSWLICYLWGCVRIFQGGFTYGSLAALIQLVGKIQGPLASAVSLLSQAYGVVSSAERLIEVIDLPEEEQGTELSHFDSIRMEDLCFQYEEGNDEVLLHLNAEIRNGDFAALTGISGGGKTSLFQLLLAIYRPTGGRIVFTDGDREATACRGTRSLFAYVPQGNTLFSGTMRENLIRFRPEATEGEIGTAIRAACLEDVVREVGLDARLGERGIGLSEGQAQRVAVARALLSGAPILLLDEATSALDEQTEARLLENISAMRDKTVIIVTHRRAALGICDYRLHMENGHMTKAPIRKDVETNSAI